MAQATARMPEPRSRDAPKFTGKRILRFLADYEYCANAAGLTDEQKVTQIVRYCDTKSEQFMESLSEFETKDWDQFCKQLLECYPSKEEKPYYKVDHLIRLVKKPRKLTTIKRFNSYYRDFVVISKALEDRKALSQVDKHDYFWRGIKPAAL